jgi:site-specific recombinase XerD
LNTLRERFNKYRDRLNLSPSYKWYSFKHTGAGKLLESGASIAELMNQLGHTDIASTYRYIRQHFGERSEHVRNNFPNPPGL